MTRRRPTIWLLGGLAAVGAGLLSLTLFLALLGPLSGGGGGCGGAAPDGPLLPGGGGVRVGATEYGGPGDPSSGTVGSSGVDLSTHPDSYAELGGTDFSSATALGGLPYGTPLRITWGGHSLIAEKEDIGLGGGPIDGLGRDIDLWWELAGHLGIPYEAGRWSGAVRIARTPLTGAGNVLGAAGEATDPTDAAGAAEVTDTAGPTDAGGATNAGAPTSAGSEDTCAGGLGGGLSVATVAGPRAQLLADGDAVAPAGAPAAVKGIIAAGNEIVGRPYLYGGGHGLPLSEIAPSYDCSSSVSHLLWGGGLLGPEGDMVSGDYESYGLPGPGRWVTIYASPDHVFMYVAGLRWDTHDAAGAGDGSIGIGWHPLVREADGFIARHPVGL